MSKSFGTDFIIVNDVQQILNPEIFHGGPWIHLATVVRGVHEYMAFKHVNDKQTYIERVDPKEPGLFKKIEDNEEWMDIAQFLLSAGLLVVSTDKEIKLDKTLVPLRFHD